MHSYFRIHTSTAMLKAKVLERGQVTIPKALRRRLGIKHGVVLEFYEEDGRLVAEKVESDNPVDQIYGSLGAGRVSDRLIRDLRGES